MIIGCTGKVAKMLEIKVEQYENDEKPFYCWHVTQFQIEDETVLLFMNDYTRFPLLMHHVDAETYVYLKERFEVLFRETMRYLRIPPEATEKYLRKSDMKLCKSWDRSILSQMNDLAYVYKFNILHEMHGHYRDEHASIDYAEIPCIKYNIYPKEKMHDEMMRLYGGYRRVS